MQKIIKKGEWKYSGSTYLPILLVEQNWDHFYEEGYSRFSSQIKRGELIYYLHFGKYCINEYGNIASDSSSQPFLSIKDAMDYAERNIEKLNWTSEDIQ